MAANNPLLQIKPHQVSKDLRGYSMFFYGAPKTGKTTIASHFPGALLLAFEKGYNAIPGIMVQPIESWGEFKKTLTYLKDEEVRKVFQTVIIDTADIAYALCEKYICSRESTAQVTYDTISDLPYGKGYALASTEFDEALRKILQLNYGLIIISHDTDKTFKNEQGEEYQQIVPTLDRRARLVCERTCDLIGYARCLDENDKTAPATLFLRGSGRFIAGSRFRHTPNSIPFTYEALVEAIANAVAEEEKEYGSSVVTSENNNHKIYADTPEYDYDALMAEIQNVIGELMQKNQSIGPKITAIVEKHLGKGKKVSECTAAQAALLDLILFDLKRL